MRKLTNINEGWKFIKSGETTDVDLPHSWNGIDGQGGAEGGKYYRGLCTYTRVLPEVKGNTFLEINGANTVCTVDVNGSRVGEHNNGYSMFRFDITPYLNNDCNVIEIYVDNSPSEFLYPESADFTFYGGLYRDVNIISEVSDAHFALLDKSRTGLYITPKTDGSVYIKTATEGDVSGMSKELEIKDGSGNIVAVCGTSAEENCAKLEVKNPQLWNGRRNPALYTLTARLIKKGEVVDEVSDKFGFREIRFDADEGCYLNGKHIKLKGVSRHQDRENIGNALTINEHTEDIELIKELGANSIRLAHYQQDEKFYRLCDENGLLIWVEIPVISRFVKKKQPQARLMLEELIKQNYNHPAIFCWGVQNEISIASTSPSLVNGIQELNDIAHRLDPTRPTTSAQLAMCPNNSKLNNITDILGYNHYFGWYFQTVEQIDKWLDEFHTELPWVKLCLSEYGAEGITTLHSANPVQGDYTEEYQALYHEHYAKAINERDWLWGSYVWNMFDFGSAKRNEGGVRGRNNKGLVTIDRKVRKDSFFLYKAYWCEEPFVYITAPRFKKRPTGEQEIKVYSNCAKVTLSVNGEKQELSSDKVFRFKAVISEGDNVITAECGNVKDELTVTGTDEEIREYSLPDGAVSFVRNWFNPDNGINPDNLSLQDSLGDILGAEEVRKIMKTNAGVEVPEKVISTLKHVRLGKVASLAEKTGNGKKYVSLMNSFLQTIKK